MRKADGNVYEGEFKAGKYEGRGVFRHADGDVYEGEFKAGFAEGRGVYRWANGNVYDGEWKADKKEGRGVYRYATGAVYDGEWKADKREGRGVYRYASGRVYDGEWKAGLLGRGVMRYANGDVYDGEYKADKKEGRGVFRYANGEVYSGFYKQGARVGEGVKWMADGRRAKRLRDGKIVEEISLEEARRTAERLGLEVQQPAEKEVRKEGAVAKEVPKGLAPQVEDGDEEGGGAPGSMTVKGSATGASLKDKVNSIKAELGIDEESPGRAIKLANEMLGIVAKGNFVSQVDELCAALDV